MCKIIEDLNNEQEASHHKTFINDHHFKPIFNIGCITFEYPMITINDKGMTPICFHSAGNLQKTLDAATKSLTYAGSESSKQTFKLQFHLSQHRRSYH